jgi:hypothetical protein
MEIEDPKYWLVTLDITDKESQQRPYTITTTCQNSLVDYLLEKKQDPELKKYSINITFAVPITKKEYDKFIATNVYR